jgi:hypothetical protein
VVQRARLLPLLLSLLLLLLVLLLLLLLLDTTRAASNTAALIYTKLRVHVCRASASLSLNN